MDRIDNRTVALTERESLAHEGFNELLEEGSGILDAARRTRSAFTDLSDDFWDWITDGAVTQARMAESDFNHSRGEGF